MIDSYTQHFTKQPDSMDDVSVVVCSHAHHGIYQFYLSAEDFQPSLMGIIRKAWVNGFTVVIYPASN